MTILRTDTISGIGATPTEGTTFDGHMKFNNPNYFTLPKGTTRERYQTKVGDIVSDNLIWHLDGGDIGSYAGVTTSGTTIYDLKGGSGMNGGVGIATLSTGHASIPDAGWVPDNGGCFRLVSTSKNGDGNYAGSKIDMPYYSLGNGTFTINVWVKLDHFSYNTDGHSYLVTNKDGGPVTSHAHIKRVRTSGGGDSQEVGRIGYGVWNGSWTYDYAKNIDENTKIHQHKWYMLTWVNVSANTMSMYVNGKIQKLHNANAYTWTSTSVNNSPKNSTSYAGVESTNGWIGQIQYYSDALTRDEIIQNYDAHKWRYDQLNVGISS